MTEQRLAAEINKIFAALFNRNDFDGLDEILAADDFQHNLETELEREAMRMYFANLAARLSGTIAVEDLVVESKLVCGQLAHDGVHLGEFAGTLNSSNQIQINAINIWRSRRSKTVGIGGTFNRAETKQRSAVIKTGEQAERQQFC